MHVYIYMYMHILPVSSSLVGELEIDISGLILVLLFLLKTTTGLSADVFISLPDDNDKDIVKIKQNYNIGVTKNIIHMEIVNQANKHTNDL
jgi:hypothetical protein